MFAIRLKADCRFDIVIDTEALKAFIEVKTERRTELTYNQPEGYFRDLLETDKPRRALTFLVPSDYAHLPDLKHRLGALQRKYPAVGIHTAIVFWEHVLEELEATELNRLNPLIGEFHNLVASWYRPPTIRFTYQEVKMMYSPEIPAVLRKLREIVDFAASQAAKSDVIPSRARAEIGVYIKDSRGRELFWWGVWEKFWEEERIPLVFGVPESQLAQVKDAFKTLAANRLKTYHGWLLSWFDSETLESDDPANHVWSRLDSVLSAVREAYAGSSQQHVV